MITIVIVCKNRLSHLKRCVDSVRNQIDTDFNLIVIDNNSVDGTIDWLEKEKIPFEIESKGFIAASRNRGISLCTTRYLMYLDSDCLIPTDFISSIKKIIELLNSKDIHSFVLYSLRKMVDERDLRDIRSLKEACPKTIDCGIHMDRLFKRKYEDDDYNEQDTLSLYRLADTELAGTHSCIFRKEDLIKIGGFDSFFDQPNTVRGEDWDLLKRLYKLGIPLFYLKGMNSYHINHGDPDSSQKGTIYYSSSTQYDKRLFREGINI